MEYAQRDYGKVSESTERKECLNPYSNGICSKREHRFLSPLRRLHVLILILMEYAQRGQRDYS